MPFVRVGAMPQPAQRKQRHMQTSVAEDPSARQKGITMEDLKKQTALRLAQEQQQKQSRAFSNMQPSQERSVRQISEPPSQAYSNASYPVASYQSEHYHYQQQHSATAGVPQILPSTSITMHHGFQPPSYQNKNVNALSSCENKNSLSASANQYYDQAVASKRGKSRTQRKPQIQPQTTANSNNGPRSPNNRYSQEQRPRYQRPTSGPAGPTSTSAHMLGRTDVDTVTQSGSNAGKTKLPHGLTVHELKEMTKARLQAEAAERHENDAHQGNAFEQRRFSPLDFEAPPAEARERAMSHESAFRNNMRLQRGNTSDSVNSIPTLVQVSAANRDHQKERQPRLSPLPPGFQNTSGVISNTDAAEVSGRLQDLNGSATNSARDWQQPSKVDAWETASVTSHNSTVVSEYLGSESAVSSGVSGMVAHGADEIGNVPFSRSRSYPAGGVNLAEVASYENTSSASASPRNTFFDAAVGGPNRRRACTLSPQPGLIHEDRPLFSEQLGFPNFSSNSRSTPLSRSRNSFSPVLPQIGNEASRIGYYAGITGSSSDGFNRPRTSSTTSLPPISHTAEEFALDRPIPVTRFSASQPLMGTSSITEEVSNSVAESVLGYPYVSTGRDGPAAPKVAASVFRDVVHPNTNHQIPAPPGLFSGQEMLPVESTCSSAGINTDFLRGRNMDSVAEVRARPAWGTVTGTTLESNSEAVQNCDVDENITDSLGSILQLSGVSNRHEMEPSNITSYNSAVPRSKEADNFGGNGKGYLY